MYESKTALRVALLSQRNSLANEKAECLESLDSGTASRNTFIPIGKCDRSL